MADHGQMAQDAVTRRLAAVLAADMVGYSRLIGGDEAGTIARQKAHRKDLIDPTIARCNGRIVKTTGDGLLVEFGSAVDAVRTAVEIQRAMAEREADMPEDRRIRYRVGINLGDIVIDGDDILGDGVNVAARLEGLAKPGGVCVSDPVHQVVLDRVEAPFRDLGLQRVKNIARPIRVWQWTPDTPPVDSDTAGVAHTQRIHFCTSADGVQIAYASVGQGPPILKAPNWLNHIEYEWRSPVWGPLFAGLSRRHRLVRFDQRGNGLSDWDVERISVDAMIADMSAVADAAGLKDFIGFGMSQGCAFSVRFAAQNPERVRCLVLLGGFAGGRLTMNSAEAVRLQKAGTTMIREGWGSPNPAYRQFFTSAFIPDSTVEQAASFDELQRVSATPENAERIWDMNGRVDVSEYARRVRAPTLVLHCRGDRLIPLEEGRRLAALIPDARFVTLEGNNHLPLDGTPTLRSFFEEVEPFLAEHGGP